MDTDGLTIEPHDVDFAATFDDVCATFVQQVSENGIELIKENPYRSLRTKLDNDRIQQVIVNFMTNAIKHTRQGHIRVGYRIEEGGIRIYCEDTGSGIPKEKCEDVFRRFVKLNDFVQGTGLGLSICKAIADSCGGRIGVDSELGKGSTFWIWIPCDIENVEKKD
jgi:signal transduction histidine kinase